MATVARTRASLRIFGDDLVPEEITDLLGHAPTKSQRKGEEVPLPKAGKFRTATTGGWWLHSNEVEPGDLDSQIDDILSKLTNDVSTWDNISSKHDIDLFCGLFMNESMEGIDISPKNLLALGSRHILLGLDIYAPDEE